MDDMNALERQVAGQLNGFVGPVLPVDDAAIFTGITAATQSPTWRFQSMFSPTKFVVAGVIVALFGGFLLAGVLTQPSDERASVGASATNEATAEPTVERTAASDILPGVDLEVEKVGLGVYRVLSDGVRDLTTNVWDVGVSRDGIVFVERHRVVYGDGSKRGTWGDGRVLRLGRPRSEAVARDDTGFELEPHPGGDLSAKPMLREDVGVDEDDGGDGSSFMWAGDRWADLEHACSSVPRAGCHNVLPRPHPNPLLAPRRYMDLTMFGFDGRGVAESVDSSLSNSGLTLNVADDGSILAAIGSLRSGDLQVSSYEEGAWQPIPMGSLAEVGPNADGPLALDRRQMAVAPDGTLWVSEWIPSAQELLAASWDGEAWRRYGPIETRVDAALRAARGPLFSADGSIWFDGLTHYDGESFTPYRAPRTSENRDPRITNVANAPDGSLWLTVVDRDPTRLDTCPEKVRTRGRCADRADGLFIITPEAVGAAG